MKQFVILGYNARAIRDWVFTNPIDGRNFGVYGDENAHINQGQLDIKNRALILWCDDIASARNAAKSMAYSNPGVSFVVARTEEVFTATMPRDITVSAAKLTEKGLVPV